MQHASLTAERWARFTFAVPEADPAAHAAALRGLLLFTHESAKQLPFVGVG